ncbi:MAG: GNAT family N-acetyltransferase [Acetatifactor sp.]|nr:GNAT family N-acetyltransferase [Acetatifactor sp.]
MNRVCELNDKNLDGICMDGIYLDRIQVRREKASALEEKKWLYVTDDAVTARRLRDQGEAVLIWFHQGNQDQDFSDFVFAAEDPRHLDPEYVEKVYRRLKGLSWDILETPRCLVRETSVEDVEDFYRIYADPSITRFMEGLYPDIEQEKAYVREYIEKVYTFFEFGVWTVAEKESGNVIGRAGFSYREGFAEPELGFIIGVPWQRRGYGEEVCRAIMKYGWETLGFESVQALVEADNEISLRLCRRLGFCQTELITLNGKTYRRLVAGRP